jgi:hypothetical protein
MKVIFSYVKNHIIEDFHPVIYIYTALILAFTIFLNYYFHIEHDFLITYKGDLNHFFFFLALNVFAYYSILIPVLLIRKKRELLFKKSLWIKSFAVLCLISFASALSLNKLVTPFFTQINERNFININVNQFHWFLIYFIGLVLLKLLYDRSTKGLYGLQAKIGQLRPYFYMLLIIAPLIIAASFMPDFLQAYPRIKPWNIQEIFGMSKCSILGINEFFYGSAYVATELIFRGALVIGMVALLGKESILPMIAVYCFYHFGKPLGETISSIFGGYILGIIAYNTRNIWGGTIIHLGIAYLMEALAMMQYYLLRK